MAKWCTDVWLTITAEQAQKRYGVVAGKAPCPDCSKVVKLTSRVDISISTKNFRPDIKNIRVAPHKVPE